MIIKVKKHWSFVKTLLVRRRSRNEIYDAALLTRCCTQHALRSFIDSETNHRRNFIKIPFIDKGIDIIDSPSIFKINP